MSEIPEHVARYLRDELKVGDEVFTEIDERYADIVRGAATSVTVCTTETSGHVIPGGSATGLEGTALSMPPSISPERLKDRVVGALGLIRSAYMKESVHVMGYLIQTAHDMIRQLPHDMIRQLPHDMIRQLLGWG